MQITTPRNSFECFADRVFSWLSSPRIKAHDLKKASIIEKNKSPRLHNGVTRNGVYELAL